MASEEHSVLPDWFVCCVAQGHRSEALQSIAGDMQTADVILQSSGDWLLQCRASEHFVQGMKAILHVEPAGEQVIRILKLLCDYRV